MKNFFTSIFSGASRAMTLKPKVVAVTLAGGLIFLVLVFLMITGKVSSCRSASSDKKINKTQANISNGQQKAAGAEGAAGRQEQIVEQKRNKADEKESVSNSAFANHNAAVRRDGNTFSGNFVDAARAYCADPDHKNDSLCGGGGGSSGH